MILDNPYHRRKVKLIMRENRELKEEVANLKKNTDVSELKKEVHELKVQLRVAKMHLGKLKKDYENLKVNSKKRE
jgi:3-polyprenyl-4-hydroxybenzoate decarboxylase